MTVLQQSCCTSTSTRVHGGNVVGSTMLRLARDLFNKHYCTTIVTNTAAAPITTPTAIARGAAATTDTTATNATTSAVVLHTSPLSTLILCILREGWASLGRGISVTACMYLLFVIIAADAVASRTGLTCLLKL